MRHRRCDTGDATQSPAQSDKSGTGACLSIPRCMKFVSERLLAADDGPRLARVLREFTVSAPVDSSGFAVRGGRGIARRLGGGGGEGEVTGVVEHDGRPFAASIRSAVVSPSGDAGVESGEVNAAGRSQSPNARKNDASTTLRRHCRGTRRRRFRLGGGRPEASGRPRSGPGTPPRPHPGSPARPSDSLLRHRVAPAEERRRPASL